MSRRAEILQELARFEKPSEPLLRELQSFGWDWSDAPLLVLRREDFLRSFAVKSSRQLRNVTDDFFATNQGDDANALPR
jgi:hypothetical protein